MPNTVVVLKSSHLNVEKKKAANKLFFYTHFRCHLLLTAISISSV